MRSLFVYTSSRFKQMPFGLHVLIILCVFAPIFALGFYIRGDSQAQVGLPKVLLIAIGSVVFFYGFFQATRWSRPLLVICLAARSIWVISQHHATYSFSDYLSLLGADGLIVWLLYFRRDVRDYYATAHKSVA